MSFFKKLFNISSESSKEKEIRQQPVHLSLDDSFVNYFINKGGKFLYCTKQDEIVNSLQSIITENNWTDLVCINKDLKGLFSTLNIKYKSDLKDQSPFLTTCEHLIADSGEILFSSNQLTGERLSDISENFIVYATTSQLVKNTGEGLTGIKINSKDSIPTNISSVKNYILEKGEDNFLNYGTNNSKNLYLLLFEDL